MRIAHAVLVLSLLANVGLIAAMFVAELQRTGSSMGQGMEIDRRGASTQSLAELAEATLVGFDRSVLLAAVDPSRVEVDRSELISLRGDVQLHLEDDRLVAIDTICSAPGSCY